MPTLKDVLSGRPRQLLVAKIVALHNVFRRLMIEDIGVAESNAHLVAVDACVCKVRLTRLEVDSLRDALEARDYECRAWILTRVAADHEARKMRQCFAPVWGEPELGPAGLSSSDTSANASAKWLDTYAS